MTAFLLLLDWVGGYALLLAVVACVFMPEILSEKKY